MGLSVKIKQGFTLHKIRQSDHSVPVRAQRVASLFSSKDVQPEKMEVM